MQDVDDVVVQPGLRELDRECGQGAAVVSVPQGADEKLAANDLDPITRMAFHDFVGDRGEHHQPFLTRGLRSIVPWGPHRSPLRGRSHSIV
ncbi:hypothetical protein ACGH52_23730 [Streptomyces sp. BBFR25]|uniref:hypothetical protein n=1 Tax=Streptomyces sp. BBFR25 TaxID=3372855 RepID=UPI0037DDA2F0